MQSDERLFSAADFIEEAERLGLVTELDRWVAARAIEILAEREQAGEPIAIHVNVSASTASDPATPEFFARDLDESGIDPRSLTLEITGTAAVEDYDAATDFADRMSELGCAIAIDDYGTRMGPFYFLKHVPFDLIKIDGDFVRGLPSNDADRLTVEAIVGVAHGLGKQTIAGYVEDERALAALKELGVDMAQGYHLGRPVALSESWN